MRTRSKLAVLTLAMISGISVTVVSCSPESTTPIASVDREPVSVRSESTLQDQYAWMGKYHNDALAYGLTKIKESRRVSKLDRCKVGLAALKDFQRAYRKSGKGSAVFDDLTITDGMCEAAAGVGAVSAALRPAAPGTLTPRHDISFSANNYMNQIVKQGDVATSVLSLSFAVAKIANQASATLDPLEAGAVAGTGSISVSSAEYWTANEAAWSDPGQLQYSRVGIEQIPRSPANISDRAKRILRADVMAAIGVLVYDWWMGEAALGKAAIKAAAASLIAGIFQT